jgi:hypothetical protein
MCLIAWPLGRASVSALVRDGGGGGVVTCFPYCPRRDFSSGLNRAARIDEFAFQRITTLKCCRVKVDIHIDHAPQFRVLPLKVFQAAFGGEPFIKLLAAQFDRFSVKAFGGFGALLGVVQTGSRMLPRLAQRVRRADGSLPLSFGGLGTLTGTPSGSSRETEHVLTFLPLSLEGGELEAEGREPIANHFKHVVSPAVAVGKCAIQADSARSTVNRVWHAIYETTQQRVVTLIPDWGGGVRQWAGLIVGRALRRHVVRASRTLPLRFSCVGDGGGGVQSVLGIDSEHR